MDQADRQISKLLHQNKKYQPSGNATIGTVYEGKKKSKAKNLLYICDAWNNLKK